MLKKLLALALALCCVFALCACGQTAETPAAEAPAEPAAPAEEATLSGTLEVWSSGEELGRFVEGFNELYPDVTVNITVVPNADFIAKLTPTLAGGQGAPDIFTGESDYVKYLVESGFWDDLKASLTAPMSPMCGIISSPLAVTAPALSAPSAGRPAPALSCIAATWRAMSSELTIPTP